MPVCPNCRSNLHRDATCCPTCGLLQVPTRGATQDASCANQPSRCRNCAKVLPQDAAYCTDCGLMTGPRLKEAKREEVASSASSSPAATAGKSNETVRRDSGTPTAPKRNDTVSQERITQGHISAAKARTSMKPAQEINWWKMAWLSWKVWGGTSEEKLNAIRELERSEGPRVTRILMMAWKDPVDLTDSVNEFVAVRVTAFCVLEAHGVSIPTQGIDVGEVMRKLANDPNMNWYSRMKAAEGLERREIPFDSGKVLSECSRAEAEWIQGEEERKKEGVRKRKLRRCRFLGIHSWGACKCSVCGKTRNAEHRWAGCRCSVCGQTRDVAHHKQETKKASTKDLLAFTGCCALPALLLLVSALRGVYVIIFVPGAWDQIWRYTLMGAGCGLCLPFLGWALEWQDVFQREVNLTTGTSTPWRFVDSIRESPFSSILVGSILGALIGFAVAVWWGV